MHPYSRISTAAGTVATTDVTSIWNRRIFINPGGTEPVVGDPLRSQYIREQRRALLDGVLATIRGHWVNAPDALARARPKLAQLAAAAASGLAVPPTLVSADPTEVREFSTVHRSTGTITKVVTPGTPVVASWERQYMVFTQRFDDRHASDAAIAAAPAIYQPEVAKAFEARAVVVGEQVLVCRMDSQECESTQLDWRHYDLDRVPHRRIDAPEAVRAALIALCRHYGLRYAAIDLAITPDGQWVFLELNPNGQWAWLEEIGDVPIGRAIAAELAGSGG